jgi:hypothetical protein
MKVINLISGPRNISTALMYSFAQRDDCTVVDEPFYGYYLYHTKSRAPHPSEDEIMAGMSLDYHQIVADVERASNDKHVFVKGMAHHLNMEQPDFLLRWKNVFLIREPASLIASFSKVIQDPTIDDIGYKQSLKLIGFLQQHHLPFVVIESDELLKDPENYLQQLCAYLDIPFSTDMLRWQPGPAAQDGIWARHWYQSVHASTGFEPRKPSPAKVPERLAPLLAEAEVYYNMLKPFILKNSTHATNL